MHAWCFVFSPHCDFVGFFLMQTKENIAHHMAEVHSSVNEVSTKIVVVVAYMGERVKVTSLVKYLSRGQTLGESRLQRIVGRLRSFVAGFLCMVTLLLFLTHRRPLGFLTTVLRGTVDVI